MPHLFQKFYRVDNKDTRDIGGTGLGLYLCRRLAEIMGGRIWAESTYTKGSTFFVELPRISRQVAGQLLEQETTKKQAEVNNSNHRPPIEAVTEIQPAQTPPIVLTVAEPGIKDDALIPANPVPRGQALTPEQIAAYVVKQRNLAQQQASPQLSRPQSINVPQRRPQ